jgi:hypothetical protein
MITPAVKYIVFSGEVILWLTVISVATVIFPYIARNARVL